MNSTTREFFHHWLSDLGPQDARDVVLGSAHPENYFDLPLNGIEIKNMVLGFLFNERLDNVVLIQKTHPEWQAGLLNGVGGKMEVGETAAAAMVREFREETNYQTMQAQWVNFGYLDGPGFNVQLFSACDQQGWLESYSDNTDEEQVMKTRFPAQREDFHLMIDNLPMIMYAAYFALTSREDNVPQFRLNYWFMKPAY